MTTSIKCPECGLGVLSIGEATVTEPYHPGYHVRGTQLPTRSRQIAAAYCNMCEYIIEVKP